MRWSNGLRFLCGLAGLSSSVYAQCYDLTSIHLYELKGRFQERWDKPIWDAKPGEGNFHLDESPWLGGLQEFVVFSIGQVQKTPSGWVTFKRTRVPEHRCAVIPERSSLGMCYWLPYETPPTNARPVPALELDQETWSLGRDGILRYSHRTRGESVFDHSRDQGSSFEATLDLNTGVFMAIAHGNSKGHYKKRIPEGVELWRDTILSAKAELIPQSCSASVKKASFDSGRGVREEEAHPVPICVVRTKSGGNKQNPFEFIVNPKHATSPEGCVVAHEGPAPRPSASVAIPAGR